MKKVIVVALMVLLVASMAFANAAPENKGQKVVRLCQFKVEIADPSKDAVATQAQLCCYPDRYVGIYLNNCGNDSGAVTSNVIADGTTVNTLKIDMTKADNDNEFKYKNRTHYVRLAVLATGKTTNISKHYNYSGTVSLVH